MQNGHYPEVLNPYAEFATKTEVHLVESQLRELTKDYAGMAVALQNLNLTMEKMNNTLETLMTNKSVNDKIKLFSFKCFIWFGGVTGTITIPILVAHWTGLIKMVGKYLMS